jgi:hypothetical protein
MKCFQTSKARQPEPRFANNATDVESVLKLGRTSAVCRVRKICPLECSPGAAGVLESRHSALAGASLLVVPGGWFRRRAKRGFGSERVSRNQKCQPVLQHYSLSSFEKRLFTAAESKRSDHKPGSTTLRRDRKPWFLPKFSFSLTPPTTDKYTFSQFSRMAFPK